MVRFGEYMESQKARLAKFLGLQAFVDYNKLKLYLDSIPKGRYVKVTTSADNLLYKPSEDEAAQSLWTPPNQPETTPRLSRMFSKNKSQKRMLSELSPHDVEFFDKWDSELQNSLRGINEVLRGQQICTVPCGPFRMSCAGDALSPEVADALFQCIELNREALRKIVKKYDKSRPEAPSMQAERVRMFDIVMAQAMDECEQQVVFAVHHHRKKTHLYQGLMILCLVVAAAVVLLVTGATGIQVCFVLGLAGGFMTAWGNAANDICNSVGTAVGARALSLLQAVVYGALFEVIGCLTLGPFVSKSIVKGIIDAEDYALTPVVYAFGMCCILFGAGSTTLLATFYGYPISATHGIIGGLIAVGMSAKGTGSVGWERVGVVACGWVGAPLAGGLMSMFVIALIHFSVYKAEDPAVRSYYMQPFYVWLCFAINILFVLVKGPVMKDSPIWLACIIATVAALLLIPAFYLCMKAGQLCKCVRRLKNSRLVKKANDTVSKTLSLDDTASASPTRHFGFRALRLEALPDQKQNDEQDSIESVPMSARQQRADAEKYFVPLLIISGLSVACAHGGNDVGNAVGPLSAIIMVNESGKVAEKPDIPIWVLCYGAAGFVIGIVTMGSMTIKTVGTKITTLTPSKSFATQMGAVVAVLGSSALGLPVSTSHCLVGSVVGIGVFEWFTKAGKLNLSVLARIVLAWGITIPLAMLVSAACFIPLKHFFE